MLFDCGIKFRDELLLDFGMEFGDEIIGGCELIVFFESESFCSRRIFVS